MDIPIIPALKSFEVVRLSYQIVRLVANESADIYAYLVESDGNRLKRIPLTLSGQEYSDWGSDDDYLLDWICSKCGLERQKPPVPPPEPPVPPEPVPPEPVVSEPVPEDPTPTSSS